MLSLKEQIATEADITTRYLDYLLTGRRNAGLNAALRIAEVTGTRASIWMRGRNKVRRRKAVEKEIEKRIKSL